MTNDRAIPARRGRILLDVDRLGRVIQVSYTVHDAFDLEEAIHVVPIDPPGYLRQMGEQILDGWRDVERDCRVELPLT